MLPHFLIYWIPFLIHLFLAIYEKQKTEINLLNFPPRRSTASTKCSWSSGDHRKRGSSDLLYCLGWVLWEFLIAGSWAVERSPFQDDGLPWIYEWSCRPQKKKKFVEVTSPWTLRAGKGPEQLELIYMCVSKTLSYK